MVTGSRYRTISTSWWWLSLNFTIAQTRESLFHKLLPSGPWRSEGLYLLTQEGWVCRGQCGLSRKKQNQVYMLHTPAWKFLFFLSSGSTGIPIGSTPNAFCVLGTHSRHFGLAYPQPWKLLGSQDQVKPSWARFCYLCKHSGVLQEEEEQEVNGC
jgi:hypothetical protein